MNVDLQFKQPGCGGTAGTFVAVFDANILLMYRPLHFGTFHRIGSSVFGFVFKVQHVWYYFLGVVKFS